MDIMKKCYYCETVEAKQWFLHSIIKNTDSINDFTAISVCDNCNKMIIKERHAKLPEPDLSKDISTENAHIFNIENAPSTYPGFFQKVDGQTHIKIGKELKDFLNQGPCSLPHTELQEVTKEQLQIELKATDNLLSISLCAHRKVKAKLKIAKAIIKLAYAKQEQLEDKVRELKAKLREEKDKKIGL